MSIVRLSCFFLALFIAGGCQNSKRALSDNSTTDDTTDNWLMEKISRPEGPPKSPEALARHIQYGIQEKDRELLASLYYRVEAEGFKVQSDKIDKSIDLLIGARSQYLMGVVSFKLDAKEIQKRKAQTFGYRVPLKLAPELTHEIRFEYHGKLPLGETRPTSVNVGESSGVYYIASYQLGNKK